MANRSYVTFDEYLQMHYDLENEIDHCRIGCGKCLLPGHDCWRQKRGRDRSFERVIDLANERDVGD